MTSRLITCKRFSSRTGFTLVELLLVIVILGILSITAVTRMNLSQKDLESVAKTLRSNLQFTQDLAMTQGTTYGFRSTGVTSYEIYEGAPGNPAKNPLTRGDLVVNIAPVQFVGLVPSVAFSKSGQPTAAGDTSILLTDGGGTRTITVQANTGFVTVGP